MSPAERAAATQRLAQLFGPLVQYGVMTGDEAVASVHGFDELLAAGDLAPNVTTLLAVASRMLLADAGTADQADTGPPADEAPDAPQSATG